MSDESLLRNFTHITIPAEIWLRRDISIQAKALWAELRSLHCKKKGGCFASEDYLCEFMGLKRSRLHEIFKELKDRSLMEIVSFNGRQTIRKAIVPNVLYVEESGQQLSAMPDSSCPENRTPEVRETGSPPYIESKDIEESLTTPPNPQRWKPAKPAIERLSFSSHVKLSQEEYDKLCQDHSKPKIDSIVQDMTDYCLAHGKSYKDYAAAIRQWLKKRTETPRQSHNAYQPDRRTLDKDGKPVASPADGLF